MRKRTPIALVCTKSRAGRPLAGWTESVDPAAKLLYMPFLETQQNPREDRRRRAPDAVWPDLRLGVKPRRSDDDAKGAARVGSRVFEVPGKFRRVRMTYFDGGQALQVFNSLWYPTFDRPDAPLLGVDLLRFGPKKFLCIVDAQPPQGRARAAHDTSTLDAIKRKYPDLEGEVSRYYDDNRFFSKQMLCGRFGMMVKKLEERRAPGLRGLRRGVRRRRRALRHFWKGRAALPGGLRRV